jgi:hypothetical protein
MGGNEWWVAVLKLLSDFQYWIAGLMGAVVATRYNKEQLKTPKDYAVFLLSGAFTAHYLTLLIMHYTALAPSHAGGIGFLTGALGGLVLQEFFAWIKSGAYKQVGFTSFFIEMMKNWFKRVVKNERKSSQVAQAYSWLRSMSGGKLEQSQVIAGDEIIACHGLIIFATLGFH